VSISCRYRIAPCEILHITETAKRQDDDYIFPGIRGHCHWSNMASWNAYGTFRRGVTVHVSALALEMGGDHTSFPAKKSRKPRWAHVINIKPEAAYRRVLLWRSAQNDDGMATVPWNDGNNVRALGSLIVTRVTS